MIDLSPQSPTFSGEPCHCSHRVQGTEEEPATSEGPGAVEAPRPPTSVDYTSSTPWGRRLLLPRLRRRENGAGRGAETNGRRRRGGTITGLLVTISLIGALAAGAAVFSPGLLRASPEDSGEIRAKDPAHQEMADALATLIGRSHAVLAVHDRGATPYLETVLWLNDRTNPGRIDPEELAILSHSEVLWTIFYYELESSAGEGDAEAEALEPAEVGKPAFCGRWRSRPDVVPRVIATGISDLRLEVKNPAADGHALLRISLTWRSDSADGPDEASVLADVVMCGTDAAE
ncbi:MAG: hypothetical protein JSV91_14480 [Phycisphaerales bacterium]|nr:MAG: hypothetical protein JSV91_14480 [Phycisphaerales bacterium]